jgi:hypothetical protein
MYKTNNARQMSAVRNDPYIQANPIIPEVDKTDTTLVARGELLHPSVTDYGLKNVFTRVADYFAGMVWFLR